MSTSQVVVRGRLRPDGTVDLDTAPDLPSGPVEVILRPLPSSAQRGEDWWQYLQRVRREAEAAGGPFRSPEEIESDREEFRSGDERIEEALRQNKGESSGGNSPT